MYFGSNIAAKTIAGDITLSDSCSDCFKHWRNVFGIRQNELANYLNVSPSVISDYESGRRNSPGINFVKKFVGALVEIDIERGGHILEKFMIKDTTGAILSLSELRSPVAGNKFVDIIKGEVVYGKELLEKRTLRGYTVVDSIMAILNFNDRDFKDIFGGSSERALVFTKVKLGRSPMIAIKVTSPKPGAIVFHGLASDDVDELAIHIAKKEKIPLIVSNCETEAGLIECLQRNLS